MRQVFGIKTALYKRKQTELELDAKLHDKQIKNQPASLNITKQERTKYDEQASALHERMKKRHKEMTNGERPDITD